MADPAAWCFVHLAVTAARSRNHAIGFTPSLVADSLELLDQTSKHEVIVSLTAGGTYDTRAPQDATIGPLGCAVPDPSIKPDRGKDARLLRFLNTVLDQFRWSRSNALSMLRVYIARLLSLINILTLFHVSCTAARVHFQHL